jgi:hypothetical protein
LGKRSLMCKTKSSQLSLAWQWPGLTGDWRYRLAFQATGRLWQKLALHTTQAQRLARNDVLRVQPTLSTQRNKKTARGGQATSESWQRQPSGLRLVNKALHMVTGGLQAAVDETYTCSEQPSNDVAMRYGHERASG